MNLRPRLILLIALVALCSSVSSAYADLTAFLGLNPNPDARSVKGLAIGGGFLVVGFEFEYANTSEDEDNFAPSLTTGMGNVAVQNPIPVNGMTFYGTVGGGFYREKLEGIDHQETSFGTNFGGGVKFTLTGPLRLRIDYRVFSLAGSPLHDRPQRIYAGLTIDF